MITCASAVLSASAAYATVFPAPLTDSVFCANTPYDESIVKCVSAVTSFFVPSGYVSVAVKLSAIATLGFLGVLVARRWGGKFRHLVYATLLVTGVFAALRVNRTKLENVQHPGPPMCCVVKLLNTRTPLGGSGMVISVPPKPVFERVVPGG